MSSVLLVCAGGKGEEMQSERVGATLGHREREADCSYLILTVTANSWELRYSRLKACWSFTWSAACSFLFYLLPFLLWKIQGFRWYLLDTWILLWFFFFLTLYPSGCWHFCLCYVTGAVLRNHLRWETAVCEERVLTRCRKGKNSGGRFPKRAAEVRFLGAFSCQRHDPSTGKDGCWRGAFPRTWFLCQLLYQSMCK